MTHIQWTEKTWNPIVGCSKISAGCANCYAVEMANRLGAIDEAKPSKGTEAYRGLTVKTSAGKNEWTGFARFVPGKVTEPLLRKKPTMYFTGSMADMFHESVHDKWLDEVMATIAQTPQHTYQILTKRPERMWKYSQNPSLVSRVTKIIEDRTRKNIAEGKKTYPWSVTLPFPNLWLGVSVENKAAISRIDSLIATPAAVHFLSCEPLLEDISLQLHPYYEFLDWIIVGGESGANARPFHTGWLMNIFADCKFRDFPLFIKQLGSNPVVGEGNQPLTLKAKKGDDMDEWPIPYKGIRQYPAKFYTNQLELSKS